MLDSEAWSVATTTVRQLRFRRVTSTRTVWTALRFVGSFASRQRSACALSNRSSPLCSGFDVASEEPKFHEILVRLADAGVEAIVVGMAAAVLQGVPATTWDLDVVHRRSPDNVERLPRVLRDLEAVARDPRRLTPGASHLLGPGHILLETRFGDFDCLGTIDGGRDYDELLAASVVVDFEGRLLRLLTLKEILAVKTRAGRPKDLATIPLIQSTIDAIDEVD